MKQMVQSFAFLFVLFGQFAAFVFARTAPFGYQ